MPTSAKRHLWMAASALSFASLCAASPAAAAVEYVKVCSTYGAGYYYNPGTDQCANASPLEWRSVQGVGPSGQAFSNYLNGGANSSVYGTGGFAAGGNSSAFGTGAYAGGNPNGDIVLTPPVLDPNAPGYDPTYIAFYNANHGVLSRNTEIPLPVPVAPDPSDPNYAADYAQYQSDLATYNADGGVIPGSQLYPVSRYPYSSFTNQNATAVGQGAQAGAGAAGQDNATAVGQAAAANALDATAVGQGSVASGGGSVAIGQGSVASAAGSVAIGQGSVADQANTVSFGAPGAERRLVNVAAGVMGTDAVNVNQLDSALASVTAAEASVNGGNTAGLPGASATGEGAFAGGYGAVASSAGAVAIGEGAQATADPTTAVGASALATANNASAFGANATASGVNSLALGQAATASALDSTAVGRGAEAQAANSVALGAGSVASRGPQAGYAAYGLSGSQSSAGEVSVGSVGNERQITNVAPGSAPTDAVNVAQLQGAMSAVRRRADGGTAAAMAMAGLVQAVTPGKSVVTGGVGTWRNQTALAFGVSHRFDSAWTLKVGGSFTTQEGGAGMNAAFGYEF